MHKSYLLLLFAFLAACSYTEKIKDGKTAYDRKQYFVATQMLPAEYAKEKSSIEKAKLAFKLAKSYSYVHDSENAKKWYQQAANDGYGPEALKAYAYTLKENQEYDEAAKAFEQFGTAIGNPYELRREVSACTIASRWLKDSKDSPWKIEASDLNTPFADYAPTIYQSDQLVITSDRTDATGEDTYGWTGNQFSDLYLVSKEGAVSSFNATINSKYNEGTLCFNKEYTEVFFTRCGSNGEIEVDYCQILSSKKVGDSWSKPTKLAFIEDGYNYMHPSLSEDGNTLYFSSSHPEGLGGFDIYKSRRNADSWDFPSNLGFTINSEGNEQFPWIDADTLYFSSDWHTGMGGLDIFHSTKMTDRWGPIQNLKSPMNSGADDFGFVLDYRSEKEDSVIRKGYLSSTRPGGKGQEDIYSFVERVLPPPPPPLVTDTPKVEIKPIVYTQTIELIILEKIYSDPENPESPVTGTRPLPDANISFMEDGQMTRQKSGAKGKYKFTVSQGDRFNFNVSKSGFFNNSRYFEVPYIADGDSEMNKNYEVVIEMAKIFKGKEIRLDNIYYDLDKSFIRADAEPTLIKLSELLKRNPDIKIQLSSHTDCQGNAPYNQTLSQARAQAAVDYLIKKGITPTRLVAKGYGESSLAIDCECRSCSDDEHQMNRRTTFKVLED